MRGLRRPRLGLALDADPQPGRHPHCSSSRPQPLNGVVQLYLFDLLHHGPDSLLGLPYTGRRDSLEELGPDAPRKPGLRHRREATRAQGQTAARTKNTTPSDQPALPARKAAGAAAAAVHRDREPLHLPASRLMTRPGSRDIPDSHSARSRSPSGPLTGACGTRFRGAAIPDARPAVARTADRRDRKQILLDVAERGRSLGVILVGAQQTAKRS